MTKSGFEERQVGAHVDVTLMVRLAQAGWIRPATVMHGLRCAGPRVRDLCCRRSIGLPERGRGSRRGRGRLRRARSRTLTRHAEVVMRLLDDADDRLCRSRPRPQEARHLGSRWCGWSPACPRETTALGCHSRAGEFDGLTATASGEGAADGRPRFLQLSTLYGTPLPR